MRPDAIMAALRRGLRDPEPVGAPAPRCELCFGSSGHPPIDGDGPPTCYPCLLKRGRWAADPESLGVSPLAALWSAHEDVVELRSCRAHVVEWAFVGWTSDPDDLVDPDAALRAVGAAYQVVVAHG